MPPVRIDKPVIIDEEITVEGFGRCEGRDLEAEVLRKDGDFWIVRMTDIHGDPADRKFHFKTGVMAGSSEVSGWKIHQPDFENITQRLQALSGNNAANEPKQEPSDMSTKTKTEETETKPKTKLTVVPGGKAAAAKVEKNGHKPEVKPEVKPKAKTKPAVEEEEEKPVAKKTSVKAASAGKKAVPETAPSPKKGQAVKRGKGAEDEEEEAPAPKKRIGSAAKGVVVQNTSAKGNSRVKAAAEEEEEAVSPGKRGRKPVYEIPAVKKGEIQIEMSEGAYNEIKEGFLPNLRSKKTTDIEKEFVKRWNEGYLFRKVFVNLTKPTAEVFLRISEAAQETWSELGVRGSHFTKATAREADKLRTGFKLKGGIRFAPANSVTPRPEAKGEPRQIVKREPLIPVAKGGKKAEPEAPAKGGKFLKGKVPGKK